MHEKKPFWKVLLRKIFYLPYSLVFDRITPAPIKVAFYTKGYKNVNSFCKNANWEDFFFDSSEKKIVLLGVGDAFGKLADQEKGLIECGIDWSGQYCGNRRNGVKIFPPSYLAVLSKSDKYIYLITKTNYIGVQTAITILKEFGVHKYYSYANMQCKRPRYVLSRLAYGFLRFRNFLIHEEGFIPSCVTFYLKMVLRPIWPKQARSSYNQIKALKNRHIGQRCFIVATGPSLRVSDVERLKDEITFGVNGVYRLFSETNWRPTYYTMVDYHAYLNGKEDGNTLNFDAFCQEECFLTDKICALANISQENERVVPLLINYLDHMVFAEHHHYRYQRDISRGIYNASTVVNSCINIAHYMGFSEIYLIGVDCNYSLTKQYFDNTKNRQATDIEHATMIHLLMQSGYTYYKKKMNKYGVKVFNATRGGNLEVFPRVSLKDIVPQRAGSD